MKHDFIINTEQVNEYGYRILTDGVDYKQYLKNPVVLFMHEREYEKSDSGKGKAVIGRCTEIRKENGNLIASVEFDEADEFAKTIAGKVERGFIRMASMYADVKATSSEPEHVITGQVYETVTKCKLVEISIVDIGGNDGALKLTKNGAPVQLQKLKLLNNMSELKTIALALGLTADATEAVILQKIKESQDALQKADGSVVALTQKIMAIQTEEATQLINKAVELGLLHEGLKDTQLAAFKADFDAQKLQLSKIITDREKEMDSHEGQKAVRQIVLGSGKSSSKVTDETFDYLQKFNPVRLAEIREKNPEEYAKLAKDYAAGVRHKD